MFFAKKASVSVEGMMCEHCAARVKGALEKVEGIQSATVELKEKKAIVKYKGELPKAAIEEAINAAGFKFVGIAE